MTAAMMIMVSLAVWLRPEPVFELELFVPGVVLPLLLVLVAKDGKRFVEAVHREFEFGNGNIRGQAY